MPTWFQLTHFLRETTFNPPPNMKSSCQTQMQQNQFKLLRASALSQTQHSSPGAICRNTYLDLPQGAKHIKKVPFQSSGCKNPLKTENSHSLTKACWSEREATLMSTSSLLHQTLPSSSFKFRTFHWVRLWSRLWHYGIFCRRIHRKDFQRHVFACFSAMFRLWHCSF